MRKIAYLGIVLILLAVLAVPAMAKSPYPNGNGNGNSKGHGNGNSVSVGENSPGVIPTIQGEGNSANHRIQHHQGNGGRGNGNQGNTHPNTPFYLQGTIKTVITGTDTIIVTLTHGNAMVKQFIGKDLSIKTTDSTQIYKITQGVDDESGGEESATTDLSSSEAESSNESDSNAEGESNRVAIPFDQLAVGQEVAIHGNLVNGVYTARLITVYVQMPISDSAGG